MRLGLIGLLFPFFRKNFFDREKRRVAYDPASAVDRGYTPVIELYRGRKRLSFYTLPDKRHYKNGIK